MMLAVGMSAELSCALRELARLHGCSVEDAARRLLLEHVGQALTLAHTELDKLRQVLRGTPTADDPPPSDEAEPSVDEED